jgi:hypothetical protein
MATGKQMLVAVKYELQQHPELKELTLNRFDVEDLCRAEPADLEDFGAINGQAEEIVNDLKSGSLEKLSQWLGVKLVKVARHPNLIPGEGFRRSASMCWTGNDNIDSVVQEIRDMRYPTPR